MDAVNIQSITVVGFHYKQNECQCDKMNWYPIVVNKKWRRWNSRFTSQKWIYDWCVTTTKTSNEMNTTSNHCKRKIITIKMFHSKFTRNIKSRRLFMHWSSLYISRVRVFSSVMIAFICDYGIIMLWSNFSLSMRACLSYNSSYFCISCGLNQFYELSSQLIDVSIRCFLINCLRVLTHFVLFVRIKWVCLFYN